jgi:hypothetical protein
VKPNFKWTAQQPPSNTADAIANQPFPADIQRC